MCSFYRHLRGSIAHNIFQDAQVIVTVKVAAQIQTMEYSAVPAIVVIVASRNISSSHHFGIGIHPLEMVSVTKQKIVSHALHKHDIVSIVSCLYSNNQ